MLPLVPVGPGHSPYASTSVFAGNPALVSLERLRDDGLLDAGDETLAPAAAAGSADLAASSARRDRALRKAFERAGSNPAEKRRVEEFSAKHGWWADDFAMFSALKRAHAGASFLEWPEALRRRDRAALDAFRARHADDVAFETFVQARFSSDLAALVDHAHAKGVALMGDAPIYVALDSTEVWAHPELFLVDAAGEPAFVAGVPPDAFSDEGQLWGNPLYDWSYLEKTGFGFWIARLEHMLRTFDAVRLDHFIGFSRYWAVPVGETSAKNGSFHPVPGKALFEALFRALGPAQLVAEDLGVVTDEVRALRDHFALPGMSVLLFSFDPGRHAESSRAHRFAIRSVVYTGTHDNDTAAGWFAGPPDDASESARASWARERDFAAAYFDVDPSRPPADFARRLVRAAFQNHARTAIVPMQDVLGLGRDARMNRPGIASGNWSFRLRPAEVAPPVADGVRALAELYGRAVP